MADTQENRPNNFFEDFTHAFGAAFFLVKEAAERGSLIEQLILRASVVDGTLRNLVAIATGVEENEVRRDGVLYFGMKALDPTFFLHDENNWFSERKMYALALRAGVINNDEFKELNELYNFRNRMVHRFIISGVKYAELEPHLMRYEAIEEILIERLSELEDKEKMTEEESTKLVKGIAEKIGKLTKKF